MRLSALLSRMLISSTVLLLACSKTGSEDAFSPPEDKERFIYVSEAVTNIPIAGAAVTLLACTKPDFEFGCQGFSTLGTFITDANGKAAYNSSLNWYKVKASKDNYWPELARSGSLTLYPVCYLKVRLVKSSSLPPDESLFVAVGRPPCAMCIDQYISVGQPADTTLYLKGYGNRPNTVHWYIGDIGPVMSTPGRSGASTPIYVHRFDTAQVTVTY